MFQRETTFYSNYIRNFKKYLTKMFLKALSQILSHIEILFPLQVSRVLFLVFTILILFHSKDFQNYFKTFK